jgi:hypothetical protein
MRISQDKLDHARMVLGTRTDAETVDAALDLIAFRNEVLKGVRRIAGSNSMRDIYAEGGCDSDRVVPPLRQAGRHPETTSRGCGEV